MLTEEETQKIYDAVLLIRYEQNISNAEVIRYLDALEDAYANVLSVTTKRKPVECHTCHKTDAEVPLFLFIRDGENLATCVKCYHDNLDLDKTSAEMWEIVGQVKCPKCKKSLNAEVNLEKLAAISYEEIRITLPKQNHLAPGDLNRLKWRINCPNRDCAIGLVVKADEKTGRLTLEEDE